MCQSDEYFIGPCPALTIFHIKMIARAAQEDSSPSILSFYRRTKSIPAYKYIYDTMYMVKCR